jgi:hypothetical protein
LSPETKQCFERPSEGHRAAFARVQEGRALTLNTLDALQTTAGSYELFGRLGCPSKNLRLGMLIKKKGQNTYSSNVQRLEVSG